MDSNTGQWFTDFIAENIVNISKGTLGPHYVISIRSIQDISIYLFQCFPIVLYDILIELYSSFLILNSSIPVITTSSQTLDDF